MKKIILISALIFMSFLGKTQEEVYLKWDTTIYTQPDNVKNTYNFYVHSSPLDFGLSNVVIFRGKVKGKAGKIKQEMEFYYTIPFSQMLTVNPNTWAITWNATQALSRSKVYFRQYITQLQAESEQTDSNPKPK